MFEVNGFQVPNDLIDEYLDKLNGNELKILLVIIRKTKGWNKEFDGISISQFQKFTGIKDERTIRKSIKKLVELGLIERKDRSGKFSVYRLTPPAKNDGGQKMSPPAKNAPTPPAKNDGGPPAKNAPHNNTLPKYTITKDTNIKKEKINKKEKNFYEKAEENLQVQTLLRDLQEGFEFAKKIIDYRYEIRQPFKSVKGLVGVLKDILETKLKTGKSPEDLFEIMSFSEWKTIKFNYLNESRSCKKDIVSQNMDAVRKAIEMRKQMKGERI